MIQLEDLKVGDRVEGIVSEGTVKIISIEWHGNQAITAFYEDNQGRIQNRLIFRSDEPTLTQVKSDRSWSFDGDGHQLRLVFEALRIRLAYQFDPYLAIHTSLVEPLPHQITAVYEEMLPRQQLRFLLADDPGAGKRLWLVC